jgi:acetoin utilization deacetylase AcuC-like enzyme
MSNLYATLSDINKIVIIDLDVHQGNGKSLSIWYCLVIMQYVPCLPQSNKDYMMLPLSYIPQIIATPVVLKLLITPFDNTQTALGNAVLFQDEPRVTTFSMHCEQNIFSKKQSSDVDVELRAGTGDVEYLAKLQSW